MSRMSQVSQFKHNIKHTITTLQTKNLPTPLKAQILKDQAIELQHSQPNISQFLDDLQNYIKELYEQKGPDRHKHYKMFIGGLDNLHKIEVGAIDRMQWAKSGLMQATEFSGMHLTEIDRWEETY